MTVRIPVSLPDLYETDFVLWTEKNAEQLRQKNFTDVDWDNVIEEIETMGRSERQAVESLLTVLIEHLLKLGYWESERERNARHWIGEIASFRVQLRRKIKTTTLKNHAETFFADAYSDARESLIEAGYIEETVIPIELIFSLEQVLEKNWFPIAVDRHRQKGD
jgi:hypothetical protein